MFDFGLMFQSLGSGKKLEKRQLNIDAMYVKKVRKRGKGQI